MSPKHFFFSPESHPSASNLTPPSGGEYITVMANRPSDPDSQEVFVGITMDHPHAPEGEAWAAVDANELRDAIDKAVGKRLAMEPAARPYRPIDRDRLLRHIEDVEASLTRRNERHEADQARIRELEAEVFTLREIKDSYEEPKTAREYLDLAFEAGHVPEDGKIHEGEQYVLQGISGRVEGPLVAPRELYASSFPGTERRLLPPRVEPTEEEKRRKDYQDLGLAGWEIELLMESER